MVQRSAGSTGGLNRTVKPGRGIALTRLARPFEECRQRTLFHANTAQTSLTTAAAPGPAPKAGTTIAETAATAIHCTIIAEGRTERGPPEAQHRQRRRQHPGQDGAECDTTPRGRHHRGASGGRGGEGWRRGWQGDDTRGRRAHGDVRGTERPSGGHSARRGNNAARATGKPETTPYIVS